MAQKRIIILGAKGMLGSELCKVFPDAIAWDRQDLDITDEVSVMEKISRVRPEFVINAAACTDVDGAESDPAAFAVNRDAVRNIALACDACSACLVHFSTDYVFDGEKEGYDEDDPVDPINAYGRSKAEGEEEVRNHAGSWYIVRTAWLFGEHGKNFVNTIRRIAKEKEFLTVVDDQKGNPTYAKDLAHAIKALLGKPFGIYHLTNSGSCSWRAFAQEIVRLSGLHTPVRPMKSDQLNRPAKRPTYSVLNNNKLPPLRPWQEALKEYLGSL